MLMKGTQIHLKEIHQELAVDVVKLVAIFLIGLFLVDLAQIALVVRALAIKSFLGVFLSNDIIPKTGVIALLFV